MRDQSQQGQLSKVKVVQLLWPLYKKSWLAVDVALAQARVCPKLDQLLKVLQAWVRQVKQLLALRALKYKQTDCGMPKSDADLWWLTRHLVMAW